MNWPGWVRFLKSNRTLSSGTTATMKDSARLIFARGGPAGISFEMDVRAVNCLRKFRNEPIGWLRDYDPWKAILPSSRTVSSDACSERGGLDCRQCKQHLLLSTASLSILGYGHNLVDEPAIALWNSSAVERHAGGP